MALGIYDLLEKTLKSLTKLNKKLCCLSESTTTINPAICYCYEITNTNNYPVEYQYRFCGNSDLIIESIGSLQTVNVCSESVPTGDDGLVITGGTILCSQNSDCQ